MAISSLFSASVLYPPESNSTFYCVVDRFRCNTLITPQKYINLTKYIKNTYIPR